MRSHVRLVDRAGLRCARNLKLTIRAGGIWALTGFAYAPLQCPRLVRQSFDARTHLLRIGAARVQDERTFPVRQEGGSRYLISASTFTPRCGIATRRARRYAATVEQGKLRVDVNQAAERVSKRQATKGAPAAAPAVRSVISPWRAGEVERNKTEQGTHVIWCWQAMQRANEPAGCEQAQA